MSPDSVIAIGMILMIVLTLVVLCIFGKNPFNDRHPKSRIAIALIAGITNLVLLTGATLRTYCIPSPERGSLALPAIGYQLVTSSICVLFVILFVKRNTVIIICCILLFYSGGRLGAVFYQIARASEEYVALDGENIPVSKNCGEPRTDLTALRLWHSWFTGIYQLKR